jgi:hypothetical protein
MKKQAKKQDEVPAVKSWYDNIEPEIRPLVKLLRDNGYNTFCSCGHEMYVDVDLGNNLSEAEDLAVFLVENGYNDFRMDIQLWAIGLWTRRAHIQIGAMRDQI